MGKSRASFPGFGLTAPGRGSWPGSTGGASPKRGGVIPWRRDAFRACVGEIMGMAQNFSRYKTGWWWMVAINFIFSHEYWVSIIIPIDVHIFQRGGPTTNHKRYHVFLFILFVYLFISICLLIWLTIWLLLWLLICENVFCMLANI